MAPEGQTGKSVVALGIVDALTREVETVGVFRPIIKGGEQDAILDRPDQPSRPSTRSTTSPSASPTTTCAPTPTRRSRRSCSATARSPSASTPWSSWAPTTRDALGADRTDPQRPHRGEPERAGRFHGVGPHAVGRGGRPVRAQHPRRAQEAPRPDDRGHRDPRADRPGGRVRRRRVRRHPRRRGRRRCPTIACSPPRRSRPGGRPSGDACSSGARSMLEHESQTVLVGAMTLPNLLARLEPEATVIMPGDRTEMIPGLLLAQTSGSFPQLAGLILTGGYEVPETIMRAHHVRAPRAADRRDRPGHLHDRRAAVPPRGHDDELAAQDRARPPPVLRARGRGRHPRGHARRPRRDPDAAHVRVPAQRDGPPRQAPHRPARVGRRPHPRGGVHRAAPRHGRHHPARRPDRREGPRVGAPATRWRAPRSSTWPPRSWSSSSPPSTHACVRRRASRSSRPARR